MNTESIINDILPALVNGETQESIAKKTGCSQPTISRWKDKLSEHIEAFQLKLIQDSGKEAVDNISLTINRANAILTNPEITSKALSDYKTVLELSHKKEVLVAQSKGIVPSNGQSVTINNLLSVTTGPDSTDIKRIRELINLRQDQDIIDIEPEVA